MIPAPNNTLAPMAWTQFVLAMIEGGGKEIDP